MYFLFYNKIYQDLVLDSIHSLCDVSTKIKLASFLFIWHIGWISRVLDMLQAWMLALELVVKIAT